jgi:hypothetical protein
LTFGALSSRREEFFWYESAPTPVDGRFLGDGGRQPINAGMHGRGGARGSGFGGQADQACSCLRSLTSPTRAPYSFHIYKIFFICEIVSGVPSPGIETDGVDFFEADKLPELSVSRVLDYQIARMSAHAAAPHLPTEFD